MLPDDQGSWSIIVPAMAKENLAKLLDNINLPGLEVFEAPAGGWPHPRDRSGAHNGYGEHLIPLTEDHFGNRAQPTVEVPTVLKDPEANAAVVNSVGSLFKANWPEYLGVKKMGDD